MTKPKRRICRDCGPGSTRLAPYPGPRCHTHHREVLKARRKAAHEKYVVDTYGLPIGAYEAIYALQGGRCWICQRATGATRRLSVDHDHKAGCGHDPKRGCRRCVRGLLCRRCNDLLGHVRDDTDTLYRALWYLANPPARAILWNSQFQPGMGTVSECPSDG